MARFRITTKRAEGVEEGYNKRSCEIAVQMKRIGMTSEQIAEVTGLSVEEIEKM